MKSLLVTVALAAVLLVPSVPALAHATLVQTSPGDGAHLDAAPEEVSVTFSEAVEMPVGALRVYDDSLQRVDDGNPQLGPGRERITVFLGNDVADGAYIVTWRAVSLDGHPVRGAFVFHVGDGATPVDDAVVAQLLGGTGETSVRAAGAVARWVTYLAALGAVGAVVFQLMVDAGNGSSSRLIRGAAWIGVVGSVIQVPLLAIEATGLGIGSLSLASLTDAASSPVGRAALVRSVALVVMAVAARVLPPSRWAWAGVVGVVAAELMSGHTLTTDPQIVVMAADAIHVLAGAIWVGGLAAMLAHFRGTRRDNDARLAAGLVGRFSTLATWSVVALTVAGLGLAWLEVRTLGALFSTAYGWTLVAKSALALAVLGMGTYNNRVLVPAITSHVGHPETIEGAGGAAVAVRSTTADDPWTRLERTVRWEAAGLIVVLAVTAVLVNIQPAAEAAGVSGPFSAYVPFGDGQINVVVDPNRAGTNQIHVYQLTATGSPVSTNGGDATLEMRLPDQDIGPIVRQPTPAGPGHWIHTGPELATPGRWEITFRLKSGFDEQTGTAEVTVAP